MIDIDYKLIGLRVKIARLKMGFTQEQLAEKVDLSSPHVSNIETGNTKLGLPTIVKIANALDVSVDELLCDNITRSKVIFENAAMNIFEDSTEQESKVMVEVLRATKDAVRRYLKISL